MEIGAILLTLAVAILVGVFISRPFFNHQFETQPLVTRQSVARSERDLSALLAKKDHILNQLVDLDFDYSMGKVSPEDYPAQRARLVVSGAALLRKLDELGALHKPAQPAGGRKVPVRMAASQTGDEIEQMIAARRQQMRQAAGKQPQAEPAGFCPKCGRPVHKEDSFCPKCGAVLD